MMVVWEMKMSKTVCRGRSQHSAVQQWQPMQNTIAKKEKDGYCKRECVWVKEEKKRTTNKTDWNGFNFHNLLLKCSLHSMYMMLYARTHIHFYTKSKCRRMNETKRCGDLLIATQRLAFHFIMVTRVRRRAHFYSLICIYDQLLHFSESHTYF